MRSWAARRPITAATAIASASTTANAAWPPSSVTESTPHAGRLLPRRSSAEAPKRTRRSPGRARPSSTERANEPTAPEVELVHPAAAERDPPHEIQGERGGREDEKESPPPARLLVPDEWRDDLGQRIAPVRWDRVRTDGFHDQVADLTVDEAPAVSIDELAWGFRQEEALRDAWIAGVKRVDQSVRREACVDARHTDGWSDGPRRRQVAYRRALGIARGDDTAHPYDLLDRADDREKKCRRACVIRAAVRPSDRDIGPHAVSGGEAVGKGTIDDDTAHRMRHQIHRGVVAANAADFVGQDAGIRVDAAERVVGKPWIIAESPQLVEVRRKARHEVIERAVVDLRAVPADKYDELLLAFR